MTFSIYDVKLKSLEYLLKSGFNKSESESIIDNIIDAELCGKVTHGLSRLPWIVQLLNEGKIYLSNEEPLMTKDRNVVTVDGKFRTGYYVMDKAINYVIKDINLNSNFIICGLKNTAPSLGMVGYYARKVADSGNIFMCFNNTPSIVAPHNASRPVFGTNPLTISIPNGSESVVLDFATSSISWGEIYLASKDNLQIPPNVAIDFNGSPTRNAIDALAGAILPMSGHKGSGLAFVIEILAGALTGSKVGISDGSWGTLFMVFKRDLFVSSSEFDEQVKNLINQLKESSNKENEVYYPGERSRLLKERNLAHGSLNVNAEMVKLLML